jgi:alpha-1,2-mannosyltransferase
LKNRPINPDLEKRLALFAWGMWAVALFFVSALIWVAPLQRSDCLTYFLAARNWGRGADLFAYNFNIDGFLYFPQFAVIYTPFQLMGMTVGQIAWRAAGWGLLATGVWRLGKIASWERRHIIFAIATAAALPASLASLRNGEANLQIAGLMLHAAAELSRRKWWWATFWLALGLALKPIMIVLLLLAAAVYRPLIGRLVIAIVILFALPFAMQRPEYVWSQYRSYVHWTRLATEPPGLYCNIRGLFGKAGWMMPQSTFKIIGAIAAAATLGLCLFARRWWKDPLRVFFVLGFSAVYLMLFNPRTESNSYVILAPVVALPAAIFMTSVPRPRMAILLCVLAFMLVCDGWAYHLTENWMKPLACIVVGVLLIREMLAVTPGAWMDFASSHGPQVLSPEPR